MLSETSYASRMINHAVFAALALTPVAALAADRVCAPSSMLKVVTAMDVPGAPNGHFGKVPKTVYRAGERYGRVEEALNPSSGLQLLVVVSEPDMWIADLASGRGNYHKDPGPTYYFRSRIFGDPAIQSRLINSLEFGCEIDWLLQAGATATRGKHPELGEVDGYTYTEGSEVLKLFAKSQVPQRLELHRNGALYAAIRYLEYMPGLDSKPALFSRPTGIVFAGEGSK